MKALLSLIAVAGLGIAGSAVAADARDYQIYGSTDFPTSGSPEAHEVFIIGLLQLHNFEFDDARASFQAAKELDPNFGMAYWGEALSYEHMLWSRYNTEASRAVLDSLGSSHAQRAEFFPTEREEDYLRSIEILFDEGTQEEREIAYSAALEEMYRKYPDDLDAAALYAVSLITTSHGGRDYSRYMRAGAITEDILDSNPRHPGALHYQIHSYDDPVHAPLGLRAAKVYSEVAPSAVHALHMGSHIYFALGMWEQGLDRNIRSYEEAIARIPEGGPYGN
jgi:tetratricopeptide (TPR) repeat protein